MLLRGLKKYPLDLSVVTSMADDGGSSGRLRKAYNIMPPGDIVSCIAAMINDDESELESLLLYRFPGNSHSNKAIDGHKLGNLIMLAEIQRTGNFYKAIEVTKRIFGVTADFYPATDQHVQLSAITQDGRRVHTETTLDLARYSEPYGLKKIYLTPSRPQVNPVVVKAILEADVIISGPGDLYTNQLPVVIVPEIGQAVLDSKAHKIFIVNIANKPFETRDFQISNFVKAFEDHLGSFPFNTIITNNNHLPPIPENYKYTYIKNDFSDQAKSRGITIVESDIVKESFPLYHDSAKLAEAVLKAV